MSQWDKLIAEILSKSPNLRFEDLCKALTRIGFAMDQPRGGSSHYTFRKAGCIPITIPRKKPPMDKVYVELVANAVKDYLSREEDTNDERS